MRIINYPFINIKFSQKTSIFIDACFLLALIDEKDAKHTSCHNIAYKLITEQPQLYISPIISAEVINKLMIDLFIKDLRFKKENTKPFNSMQNIRLILDYFPNSDKTLY